MKSIFLGIAVAALCLPVVAQQAQPGPESTNNNSNAPSANAPATTPPQAQGTTRQSDSPATKPSTDKAAPASGSPAQTDDKAQPQQPTTELLPQTNETSSADPLLEPKPLPDKSLTLIGGTAVKVDQIRNKLSLQPFGGGKRIHVVFDDRSHIFRDGRETTVLGINKGDRVYVDTMLLNGQIFARSVRVLTQSGPAEARGQILNYDARTGRVNMQDQLTSQNISFTVPQNTPIARKIGGQGTTSDLKPGSLIDVMFAPGQKGGSATQISVLAVPGEKYVFAGRITHLDLRSGVMAVDNQTDERNYEIRFDPSKVELGSLQIGTEVTAQAQFDGRNYYASQVTVVSPAAAAAEKD